MRAFGLRRRDRAPVDGALAAVALQEAHRPRVARRGWRHRVGAVADEELRHLGLVEVRLDGLVVLRADGVEDREDPVLLHEPPRLLHGLRRVVRVVVEDVADLPSVDAATRVDVVEVRLGAGADRAERGRDPRQRHRASEHDLLRLHAGLGRERGRPERERGEHRPTRVPASLIAMQGTLRATRPDRDASAGRHREVEVEQVAAALRGRRAGQRELVARSLRDDGGLVEQPDRVGPRPGWSGTPPAETTISLPPAVRAASTATRRDQPACALAATRTVGAPKTSAAPRKAGARRTTLPFPAIVRRTAKSAPVALVFGQGAEPAGCRAALVREHDRWPPVDPVPLAAEEPVEPQPALAQHRPSCPLAGNVDGEWPWLPSHSRFGPRSAANARVAWSMGKRKSRRPCIMKTGVLDALQAREARPLACPGGDCVGVGAREGRGLDRLQRRCLPLVRDRGGQSGDEAGLEQALRDESVVEVGPRLHHLDGRPRHARGERVPDRAAAVRDAPGADPRVGDVGPVAQPLEDGARVRDLARPVDRDQPARRAVAAGVERQDGVLLADEPEALGHRVHVLALAGRVRAGRRSPASRPREPPRSAGRAWLRARRRRPSAPSRPASVKADAGPARASAATAAASSLQDLGHEAER